MKHSCQEINRIKPQIYTCSSQSHPTIQASACLSHLCLQGFSALAVWFLCLLKNVNQCCICLWRWCRSIREIKSTPGNIFRYLFWRTWWIQYTNIWLGFFQATWLIFMIQTPMCLSLLIHLTIRLSTAGLNPQVWLWASSQWWIVMRAEVNQGETIHIPNKSQPSPSQQRRSDTWRQMGSWSHVLLFVLQELFRWVDQSKGSWTEHGDRNSFISYNLMAKHQKSKFWQQMFPTLKNTHPSVTNFDRCACFYSWLLRKPANSPHKFTPAAEQQEERRRTDLTDTETCLSHGHSC